MIIDSEKQKTQEPLCLPYLREEKEFVPYLFHLILIKKGKEGKTQDRSYFTSTTLASPIKQEEGSWYDSSVLMQFHRKRRDMVSGS